MKNANCANCGTIFLLTERTLAVGASNDEHLCHACEISSTSRYEVLVLSNGRRFRSWRKRPAPRPKLVAAPKLKKAVNG